MTLTLEIGRVRLAIEVLGQAGNFARCILGFTIRAGRFKINPGIYWTYPSAPEHHKDGKIFGKMSEYMLPMGIHIRMAWIQLRLLQLGCELWTPTRKTTHED